MNMEGHMYVNAWKMLVYSVFQFYDVGMHLHRMIWFISVHTEHWQKCISDLLLKNNNNNNLHYHHSSWIYSGLN